MSRVLFLLKEAMISLRRNILIVVGAILAVFISLSLALGALVVNEILRLNTIAWQEGVHVIAFLNDEGGSGVPIGAHDQLLKEVMTGRRSSRPSTSTRPRPGRSTRSCSPVSRSCSTSSRPSCRHRSASSWWTSSSTARSRFGSSSRPPGAPGGHRRRVDRTTAESLQRPQRAWAGMAIVLGVAAVVLIANTIRLAIYART